MTTARTRLTDSQLGAWRLFLRAHAQITRRLEHDLLTEQELPLASYEVLLHLAEAPGNHLRMTELADRVLLSRSGLTRLVDRLEGEGLVTRVSCPSDARGTNAVLTEAGRDRLRSAAPTHLRGIAEHVTDRLTPEEVTQLSTLMHKLLLDPVSPPEGGCGGAEGL
ncbi:MAG TPA: MarR family transcriptional regulator [Mycobacteriales bacterium]|nr:MarR family transcriptional regulator [Mycobacteriales bacterium]